MGIQLCVLSFLLLRLLIMNDDLVLIHLQIGYEMKTTS